MKSILEIRRQQLDRQAALREHDQLELVLQELERYSPRFRQIRSSNTELGVDDRRVHEQEELLSARRAALVDELERLAGQPFGKFARVRDRRRRADEDGVRSVVAAHALHTTQDVREVTAEHAAIGMQFVDDDEAQVLEELRPAGMVRQDPRVEHVGVAEDDVGLAANRAARVRWRIAVVGEDANLEIRISADQFGQSLQLGELILREGLGRKEVQRARRLILEDGIEDRRVVAERLSRRRRRDRDDVAPAEHMRERLGLMGIQLADPACGERAPEPVVSAVRIGRKRRGRGRQPPHGRHDRIRLCSAGSGGIGQPADRFLQRAVLVAGNSRQRL